MLVTVPQLICHSIKRPGKIADLVLCVCTYAVIQVTGAYDLGSLPKFRDGLHNTPDYHP